MVFSNFQVNSWPYKDRNLGQPESFQNSISEAEGLSFLVNSISLCLDLLCVVHS